MGALPQVLEKLAPTWIWCSAPFEAFEVPLQGLRNYGALPQVLEKLAPTWNMMFCPLWGHFGPYKRRSLKVSPNFKYDVLPFEIPILGLRNCGALAQVLEKLAPTFKFGALGPLRPMRPFNSLDEALEIVLPFSRFWKSYPQLKIWSSVPWRPLKSLDKALEIVVSFSRFWKS